MPHGQLDTKELINLAAASNKERLSNIGDKVISSLGRFDKHIESLGKIESQSVDELAQGVASRLDKNGAGEIEAPNLALLAHLAPNTESTSLSHVLNSLSKELDMSEFNALKDMYVKTAGEWHNLTQNAELAKLTLSPYLLQAIEASGRGLKRSRAENFTSSLEKIEYMLKNTDSSGSNALLDKDAYSNLLSELLGYSLARFARLENPAANLYEFLKGARDGLENQVAPSLFGAGKPLKEADIYDFIELSIKSGESSPSTSAVIDALPALREKHRAFAESGKSQGENFIITKEGKAKSPSVEIGLNPQVKDMLELDSEVLRADLEKLKNSHPELFETKGSVARLIKKIQENPTFFFNNNRLDMKLVGSYIDKNFAEIGIVTQGKNTGDVGHILQVSDSQKRINSLSKREESMPPVESVKLDTLHNGDGRDGAKKALLETQADSTPKLYKMQETKIESEQDLGKYASMLGLKFENDAQAKAAYEFINANRARIEC